MRASGILHSDQVRATEVEVVTAKIQRVANSKSQTVSHPAKNRAAVWTLVTVGVNRPILVETLGFERVKEVHTTAYYRLL